LNCSKHIIGTMEESFLSHLTLSIVNMLIYKGISGQCKVSCNLKVNSTIFPPLLCSGFDPYSFYFFWWHNLKYILYLGYIYYDSLEPDISSYEIIIVELIG